MLNGTSTKQIVLCGIAILATIAIVVFSIINMRKNNAYTDKAFDALARERCAELKGVTSANNPRTCIIGNKTYDVSGRDYSKEKVLGTR